MFWTNETSLWWNVSMVISLYCLLANHKRVINAYLFFCFGVSPAWLHCSTFGCELKSYEDRGWGGYIGRLNPAFSILYLPTLLARFSEKQTIKNEEREGGRGIDRHSRIAPLSQSSFVVTYREPYFLLYIYPQSNGVYSSLPSSRSNESRMPCYIPGVKNDRRWSTKEAVGLRRWTHWVRMSFPLFHKNARFYLFPFWKRHLPRLAYPETRLYPGSCRLTNAHGCQKGSQDPKL